MAKTTAVKTSAPTEPQPPIDPCQLAGRAIRAITGCGALELNARLDKLNAETIEAIAKAEADNNRDTITKILLDAALANYKPK